MKPSKLASLAILACFGSLAGFIPAIASPNLDVARQLNQAFVEVADKVSPAVVVITVTQNKSAALKELADLPDTLPRRFLEEYRRRLEEESPQGQGSGVIIRKDGFILTNGHVVEDAEKVEVRLQDGRKFTATVRGTDAQSDMAVVKIDATNLPTAKFADSAKTRVGEFAIAIGAPFELDYSVTFGHVSAKGRSKVVPWYAGGNIMDQDFIQTDANINPGNSGGPLVNIDGDIIGINTLIRGLHTGIGFAVPSNLAREVSDALIANGKITRAWLGVGIEALKENTTLRERVKNVAYGVADGVVITAILPDGPAAKSELRASDIVTAVDGQRVSTPQELRNEVRGKKIGSTMALNVFRLQDSGQSKRMTVMINAAERVEKIPDIVAKVEPQPARNNSDTSLGLTIQSLTPELAEKFSVKAEEGVLVATVEKDGLAARFGIKPGDVITAVNQKPVANPRQFRQATRNLDLKKGVLVNLVSGETARFEILKEAGK